MARLFAANLIHVGFALLGLAVLLALFHIQERATSRYLAHRLGWRSVLLTGWLGVAVHELSHLFFAKLFGHRIIAWKLFDPDPISSTLGYVRHAYRRRSLWQLVGTFFIGVAPLCAGAFVFFGLLHWMLPSSVLTELMRRMLVLRQTDSIGGGLRGLGDIGFWLSATAWAHRTAMLPLQLYIGICIANHIAPSPVDLVGAFPGALFVVMLLVLGTGIASSQGVSLAWTLGMLIPPSLLFLMVAAFQILYLATVALVGRISRGFPH